MSAGAVIVRRQNRYMRRFADAGATAPEHAVTLEELRLRDSWIFRRMVARAVFQPVSNRWWMDADNADRFRDARKKRILIFMLIAITVVVAIIVIF